MVFMGCPEASATSIINTIGSFGVRTLNGGGGAAPRIREPVEI
jgi:hypothetical protein